MSKKTMDLVEDLLREKNVIPYCFTDIVDDTIYLNKNAASEFVNILTLGDKHPNWETGLREGMAIVEPLKGMVSTRKDVKIAKKDSDFEYTVVPRSAIYCPVVYAGVGTYIILSLHKGNPGLLYEAIKKAFEVNGPKDRWTTDFRGQHFWVDEKEVSGMMAEPFLTRYNTYSLELAYVYVKKNGSVCKKLFEGIAGFDDKEMGGVMDSVPDFDLSGFFGTIYETMDSLKNK